MERKGANIAKFRNLNLNQAQNIYHAKEARDEKGLPSLFIHQRQRNKRTCRQLYVIINIED